MSNFKIKTYKGRIFFAVFLIIFILVLRYISVGSYINLEAIKNYRDYLKRFVAQQYLLTVFIYIFSLAIASFLSIPITVLLNILAGFLFGGVTGAFYVNIGTTVGATCSFLTFRYLLSDLVARQYADKLKAFNDHIKKYGANYLLSLQLFPATPSLLINTLSGLTSISVWTFIWTTSIGIVPGSLVYTIAGQQLSKIESVKDILTLPVIVVFILLGLLSLLPLFIKKWNTYKNV